MVILLLSFPLQYALDNYNHNNIMAFYHYVNNAKEQAKQQGYFTDSIVDELKFNLSQQFDISEAELIIDVTETPKYRKNAFDETELIHYRIGVPINKVVAVNKLWGISDADNSGYIIIDEYASSELIMP